MLLSVCPRANPIKLFVEHLLTFRKLGRFIRVNIFQLLCKMVQLKKTEGLNLLPKLITKLWSIVQYFYDRNLQNYKLPRHL
jgi:hypothetical protein